MGSRVPPAHSHGSGPGQHDGHPHLRLGGAHRHHHHPAHAAEGHHLDQVVRGGLPYHTTDKSLREHFEVYGDIEEAVVITDRSTGKSRGYGFVIMSNKEAAERACKEPNPIIDGRKANVNLAILGAKPRGNLTGFPAAALMAGAGQYGQPVAAPASHPYLQQLYAAAAQQQQAAYGLTPNISRPDQPWIPSRVCCCRRSSPGRPGHPATTTG